MSTVTLEVMDVKAVVDQKKSEDIVPTTVSIWDPEEPQEKISEDDNSPRPGGLIQWVLLLLIVSIPPVSTGRSLSEWVMPLPSHLHSLSFNDHLKHQNWDKWMRRWSRNAGALCMLCAQ